MVPTEAYSSPALATSGWYSLIDNHQVEGASPPPNRVFGDPGDGNIYYGATTDNLAARESFVGQTLGAVRRYYNNGQGSTIVSAAAGDLALRRVPWVSIKWNSPAYTWAQVASGSADSWMASHFASLAASGKGPIMWTAHAEPNGDGQPAADHKAMYARIKTFTDDYPQILLTPVLSWNYFDVAVGPPKVVYADWATSAECDIFGFNSYNHASWQPLTTKKNLTVQQVFGLQQAQLAAMDPNKPWAVSEWGVRTNKTTPGAAATEMTGLFDFARNNGGYALTFYDSNLNVNDGGSPWDLDDTTDGTDGTERINRFKTISLSANAVRVPAGGIAVP
jgi:hypothetical protein